MVWKAQMRNKRGSSNFWWRHCPRPPRLEAHLHATHPFPVSTDWCPCIPPSSCAMAYNGVVLEFDPSIEDGAQRQGP